MWLDVHARTRVRKKMQHSQSCFCSVNIRKKKRVIPPDGLMNAMEIIDERGFKMQAEAKREPSRHATTSRYTMRGDGSRVADDDDSGC